MALTPNFTASNSLQSPSIITLTDTSTGSDVDVVSRRVTISKPFGGYLVPSGTLTNYIVWAYANSSISINAITRDFSINVLVEWLNVDDDVLYFKEYDFNIIPLGELFNYKLIQSQVGQPNITSNITFYKNKSLLELELDSSKQAVIMGGDILAGQQCIERALSLKSNYNNY
jgi:hypothetical protein